MSEEKLIVEEKNTLYKYFPIFEDFVILKPTENTGSSPENIQELKTLFTLSN